MLRARPFLLASPIDDDSWGSQLTRFGTFVHLHVFDVFSACHACAMLPFPFLLAYRFLRLMMVGE